MIMTDQQVAVVTGAGSGLGRLITITLAGKGWFVAAAGRRLLPLEETAHLAAAHAGAGSVLPVMADVGDPESVAGAVRHGGGAVRPAGPAGQQRGDRGAARRGGRADARGLAVDRGHQPDRLLPVRAPRGADDEGAATRRAGRIINNGSISAHAPRPGSFGYTVTKHAITGLTKSISLDGRPYNIACGQIDIGNANTRDGPVDRGGSAAGGRVGQAGADVRPAARGRCGRLHGGPAAGRERPVPDDNGDTCRSSAAVDGGPRPTNGLAGSALGVRAPEPG